MNSYPPELLVQLAPVMFVGGLDAPPNPPADSLAADPSKRTQDPFVVLSQRLRGILGTLRTVAVWQPERPKAFRVIFVEKTVQFPPQKIHPQNDTATTPHSPLSPLIATSPLHPDGLIAPIWIRKHTTLVPSVFVLFLRLYESPPDGTRTPLDLPDSDKEKEREKVERRKDTELSAEIAERKKTTTDRGIKLTVVLLASRKMLDDPTLDGRLTFIRRQGGLDSRAALFVLSPIHPTELGEFVRSLHSALFEPALEYYTTHSKRVRRKRNRHNQTYLSSSVMSAGPGGPARPLRPEGWTIRYEYKMAAFAEFRGEDEVALKHYQDAYAALSTMFGSASILVPRTKRWAEAKVLVDTISMKICKLYLYNGEHSLSLSQFNSHLRTFSDLSRSWGIGEETFEYWSWMTRQYRLLGELLDLGIQASSLEIPTYTAPTQPVAPSAAAPPPQPGQAQPEPLTAIGLNPSTTLQHPGHYFYVAAQCTERRQARYMNMVHREPWATNAPPPGFSNEQKVDHYSIILELYTKSLDFYKKYAKPQDPDQSRVVMWVDYRIALAHHAAGKDAEVVKYLERISRSYSDEQWGLLLAPLLSTWYTCARRLGDIELSVRLLIEMLGRDYDLPGGEEEGDERGDVQDDLIAILKSTAPPDAENPFVVDLTAKEPLFDSAVMFWSPKAETGKSVAFQICLRASSKAPVSALTFSSMDVFDGEGSKLLVIRHKESAEYWESEEVNKVQCVDVGALSLPLSSPAPSEITADLRWLLGSRLVLKGTVTSTVPKDIKFSKATLHLVEGIWRIEVPFLLQPHSAKRQVPVWLSSISPPRFTSLHRTEAASLTFKDPKHDVQIAFQYDEPAYTDELFPITVEVLNADRRDLEVVIDVLLQPGEDDSVNRIVIGDEESTGLIREVPLGTLKQGVTARKTLYLAATGAGGSRTLDVSIRSRVPLLASPSSPVSPSSPGSAHLHHEENLRTLTVAVSKPWRVAYDTTFRRPLDVPGLSDLSLFEGSSGSTGMGGEAVVCTTFECGGPWGIQVEGIKFNALDSKSAAIKSSSLDYVTFPVECFPGDQLSDVCELTLPLLDDFDDTETEKPITSPGQYVVSWRRILPSKQLSELAVTRLPLPPLRPPTDDLVALLRVPPEAYLHEPIVMELTIRNFHPTRSANPHITLELDASDSFVVAGMRSGRLPVLLPGTQQKLSWRLTPLECGPSILLPKIKLVNKRNAVDRTNLKNLTPGVSSISAEAEPEEEAVKIVDLRWDMERPATTSAAAVSAFDAEAARTSGSQETMLATSRGSILVLPRMASSAL